MITQYVLRSKSLTPLLLMIVGVCCALTTSVHAQAVHIPDPNLRAAIADELGVPHGALITEAGMKRLTELHIHSGDVRNLTGMESATNLIAFSINGNPTIDLKPIVGLPHLEFLSMFSTHSDITPLANLTNLRYLDIAACGIVDISPLSHLTKLRTLNARINRIVDITPLANLTNLVELRLSDNKIRDVSPLSGLSRLEILEIHANQITDHGPLDALALSHFRYDETCEMPPLPLQPRLENRQFPSIFARWSGPGWPPVSNRPDLTGIENVALHDLRFSVGVFDLGHSEMPHGFEIRGDMNIAIDIRDRMLAINPNMINLMDIRLKAAGILEYPPDWPYWIRDAQGNVFEVDPGVGLIDFTHPDVQDRIVQQAIAVSKCGLLDGISFDHWNDIHPILVSGRDDDGNYQIFRGLEAELKAKLSIVQRIRAATRPDFLIMGNVNYRTLPTTGPYVNGGFMETIMPGGFTGDDLEFVLTLTENSLTWLDNNLREPRINGLEGWTIPTEAPDSPNNLRWMRATTTLSLTHSDGYVVYTISDKTSESVWTHYWYDFWDADLGRPVGAKATLYDEEIPGLYIREFTNGWAVYNHSGEAQVITLPEEAQGVASGLVNTEHALPNLDGEMYLRVKPKNPADVNGDGVVNIFDLTLVAQAIGTGDRQGDVNEDGVVNVFDLVFVAGAIGGGGAAPSAYSLDSSIISAGDVERWLALAGGIDIGDANFQRGIRFLEGLLAALTPKETMLLPNYPNPFNPETWIPYRLAREAEVAITIYDTKGTPVRRLALGNQAAGYYAARGKAAYWDGRNEDGEAVASGIYVYQFRAGNYAASRRMVIVK